MFFKINDTTLLNSDHIVKIECANLKEEGFCIIISHLFNQTAHYTKISFGKDEVKANEYFKKLNDFLEIKVLD